MGEESQLQGIIEDLIGHVDESYRPLKAKGP